MGIIEREDWEESELHPKSDDLKGKTVEEIRIRYGSLFVKMYDGTIIELLPTMDQSITLILLDE